MHGGHQGARYEARNRCSLNTRHFEGEVSNAPARPRRKARHRSPSTQENHLCSRMLLARPQLSLWKRKAQIQRILLAAQTRENQIARRKKQGGLKKQRLGASDSVGMLDKKTIELGSEACQLSEGVSTRRRHAPFSPAAAPDDIR